MTAVPSPAADPGVELLQRALDYTRGALATVRAEHLCDPTPCDLWRLGDLLAHMEDALDAFAEGAEGAIDLHSAAPAPVEERLETIRTKACGLLGAWASAPAPVVLVGGQAVPVDTIARLAAVEITVHGWDVHQTTGSAEPVPAALAEELLPTAFTLGLDQHGEFGPPVAVPSGAGPARRMLALLGRADPRPD